MLSCNDTHTLLQGNSWGYLYMYAPFPYILTGGGNEDCGPYSMRHRYVMCGRIGSEAHLLSPSLLALTVEV